MVRTQIEARGIRDPAVLAAFRAVPREAFLPPELHEFAYEDSPLPIAQGQTISQPYTIERHPELAEIAASRLAEVGLQNLEVRCGDGSLGWPEHAPYDAISVTAGGPGVPRALLDQLAPGGRLLMPVGEGRTLQKLVRVTRQSDGSRPRIWGTSASYRWVHDRVPALDDTGRMG